MGDRVWFSAQEIRNLQEGRALFSDDWNRILTAFYFHPCRDVSSLKMKWQKIAQRGTPSIDPDFLQALKPTRRDEGESAATALQGLRVRKKKSPSSSTHIAGVVVKATITPQMNQIIEEMKSFKAASKAASRAEQKKTMEKASHEKHEDDMLDATAHRLVAIAEASVKPITRENALHAFNMHSRW
jgi:hypothetical protein